MFPASRQNLANSLLCCAVIFLTTACFWSSARENEVEVAEDDPVVAANANRSISISSQPAQASLRRDNGDFIVQHLEITTPRYKEIDRQVKDARLLDNAAEKLNDALALPADIFLRTKDCKDVNAFYDANDRTVTMCYELMEHFYRVFKTEGNGDEKAYAKMNDAVRFVFLHEIGHALIHLYKLPVAGNEEDAADRASAYINLKELGEEGVRAVYAAADAFAIESKQSENSKRNLADEHLLQEQRFYNSLCMIYGSDPAKHARIVENGYLPKQRAARCQGEYQRTVESWVDLLKPWRKN